MCKLYGDQKAHTRRQNGPPWKLCHDWGGMLAIRHFGVCHALTLGCVGVSMHVILCIGELDGGEGGDINPLRGWQWRDHHILVRNGPACSTSKGHNRPEAISDASQNDPLQLQCGMNIIAAIQVNTPTTAWRTAMALVTTKPFLYAQLPAPGQESRFF